MGTFVSATSVASTTDQASVSTNNIGLGPIGNLAVILLGCTDLTPTAAQITITNNAGMPGFVPVARALSRTSLDAIYLFVGTGLEPTNNGGRIYTFTFPATTTGIWFNVLRVSGMKRTGLAAVRQVGVQENAAPGTPTIPFGRACLSNNMIMSALINGANPPGINAPGGWSLFTNVGYATPTTGFTTAVALLGITDSTVTWGAASATDFAALAVEFDTSDYTSGDTPQFEAGIGV